MKTTLVIISLVYLGAVAFAELPRACVVCQQPLTTSFVLMSSPMMEERQPVCESCARLTSLCFTCGLPVKVNFLKLEDGRFLCERDGKSAVVTQEEARILFGEVKRDLMGMFSGLGPLPDRNIAFSLLDRFQLAKLNTLQDPRHDKQFTLGLTHTQTIGQRFEHTIYLLSGLSRSRLLAVEAHEYAHAWLRENVAKERRIDPDTVEGFCELVAYKLMSLRGEEGEKKVIQANLYSRGQIEILLQAEADYDFYRLTKWMKNGSDEKLMRTNTARLLILNEPRPVTWAQQETSASPQALMLRGITGNSKRRFALINNRTLEKNEEAVIRIGTSNLVVRCLEVTENAVVVTVNGSKERQHLTLEPN